MKGILIQFGSTFIVSLLCSMAAFSSVWPSYTLRILESERSPLGFKITQNEGNLISSIPMLGSLISTLMAGYLAESLGRKNSQILCGLLNAVSWSLIVTARSTVQVVVGRFLNGFGAGIALPVLMIHVSETTQLSIRGSATSLTAVLYNVGVLVSYILGWFCSYELICYISLTSSVIFTLLMACLKETPTYLLKIKKEKEALSSLKFYRGQSETTEAILEELSYLRSLDNGDHHRADAEKPLSEKDKLRNENNENTENKNPWILLLTVAHNRRAIISSVTFVILSVFMGMIAVQTYAGQFFATAAPMISPDLCAVLLAVVMVLTCLLTMVVTDLVPRRTLMISTCAVATVCLAVLGAVMRWPGAPVWVAPLAILIFCFAYLLGVINTVFVQVAESFGPRVNSVATAIVFCFMFASNFLVVLLFMPAVEYLGIDGTFFLFAVISGITTVLSFFWMKETRLVPIEKVQEMYANGFLYQRVSSTES